MTTLSQLLESLRFGDENYVDPLEPYLDSGMLPWRPVSSCGITGRRNESCYELTEETLAHIRESSRILVTTNEFAINAIENRINYIVGIGHKYHVVTADPKQVDFSQRVQQFLDEFLTENDWNGRQQEIVRRCDRDGEVFLRLFSSSNGKTVVRFVEPDQIYTPTEHDTRDTFGIRTKGEDVETVLGYWIDGRFVAATEIQHRKANVDRNVKRGLPLLYPVQKNLRRAEKLLRNMSVVAEIQSAIALIRKHNTGNVDAVRRFVQNQMTQSAGINGTVSGSGHTPRQRFEPGTIIDADGGTEYEFPITAIDASRYILVLQAELRAIASRLVMPEFMLSSDASNANYSSTMIAEGPAVRMFERMQQEMIRDDIRILDKVLQHAAQANVLPADTRHRVSIHAVPPMVAVRDRLKEAQADRILMQCGVLSAQTMAMRYGLDPTDENNLRCNCVHLHPENTVYNG